MQGQQFSCLLSTSVLDMVKLVEVIYLIVIVRRIFISAGCLSSLGFAELCKKTTPNDSLPVIIIITKVSFQFKLLQLRYTKHSNTNNSVLHPKLLSNPVNLCIATHPPPPTLHVPFLPLQEFLKEVLIIEIIIIIYLSLYIYMLYKCHIHHIQLDK